jgi:hypothetical protein
MARQTVSLINENTTLVLLLLLFIVLAYLYYIFVTKMVENKIVVVQNSVDYSIPRSRPNVILDPYGPPLRTDGLYFDRPMRGIPVNIETRGMNQEYTQLGILTRESHKGELILPLMGRRLISGLDKWQYYTISNTGNMNTKLPISVKGRSCSGEYGCDCVSDGDIVYVEGYQDTFKTTLYEPARFNYIPYI